MSVRYKRICDAVSSLIEKIKNRYALSSSSNLVGAEVLYVRMALPSVLSTEIRILLVLIQDTAARLRFAPLARRCRVVCHENLNFWSLVVEAPGRPSPLRRQAWWRQGRRIQEGASILFSVSRGCRRRFREMAQSFIETQGRCCLGV